MGYRGVVLSKARCLGESQFPMIDTDEVRRMVLTSTAPSVRSVADFLSENTDAPLDSFRVFPGAVSTKSLLRTYRIRLANVRSIPGAETSELSQFVSDLERSDGDVTILAFRVVDRHAILVLRRDLSCIIGGILFRR